MEAPPGDGCSPEGAKASAVYQLLLRKGLVDKNGAFVWDKTLVSVDVNDEVKKFWYSKKMLKNNLNQMMEEAAEQEVELPDDIMPDFQIPSRIPMQETNVPAKKKSKWGPVQPVR
jgi:hypothetical protein